MRTHSYAGASFHYLKARPRLRYTSFNRWLVRGRGYSAFRSR
jgi:hypothetical protein